MHVVRCVQRSVSESHPKSCRRNVPTTSVARYIVSIVLANTRINIVTVLILKTAVYPQCTVDVNMLTKTDQKQQK